MDWTKLKQIWRNNKFVLTFVIFVVYATFFSNYNIFRSSRLKKEIKTLKEQRDMYIEKIRNDSIKLYQLRTNDETFERFARENYYFHKKNEDVFIIEENK